MALIPILRFRGMRSCTCDACQLLATAFAATGDVGYTMTILMVEDSPGVVTPHERAINRVAVGAWRDQIDDHAAYSEGYHDSWSPDHPDTN